MEVHGNVCDCETRLSNGGEGICQEYLERHSEIKIPLTHPDSTTNLQELAMAFETKDSGDKKQFPSGMTRNSSAGKLGWHRITEGPMAKRWAELLTRGAVIYPDCAPGTANWTLANSELELYEAREKAYRHFMEWWYGTNPTEDAAAGVFFNINLAEHVKEKLKTKTDIPTDLHDLRQG